MRDAETIEQTKTFFLTKFKNNKVQLSTKQRKLLDQIILRAAKDDVVLYTQEDKYINFILQQIPHLSSTATDDVIIGFSENVWHTIDLNLKKETEDQKALYAQNARDFRNDNIRLDQDPSLLNLWLTNKHLQAVMPKDTKSFIVLAPVEVNALRAIDVRSHLNNEDVKSIVLPIGPGHWRLAQVEKTSINGNPHLKVSIFDSFGENSGKTIHADVKNWLTPQTKLPFTITYDAPPKKQNNGYECGDFVTAQAHKYAQEAKAAYEPAFVEALAQGKSLRPLMIEKSKNPEVALNPVISAGNKTQLISNTVGNNPKEKVEPVDKQSEKWVTFFKKIAKDMGVLQQPEPQYQQEASKKWDELIEKGKQEAEKILKQSPEEKGKIGEKVIAYQTKSGSEVLVDKKTQIELDELYAKELQAQEEDSPRRGPR